MSANRAGSEENAMLKISESNSILSVTMSREEVRNAFNPELIQKITEAFLSVRTKSHLRAVIFRGEGKVFCAGADLSWMKSMAQFSAAENYADSEKLFEMFEAIRICPVPVVTLVQGAAFGGALGLIAASDYVVAEAQTQLCFSEVKIGLLPAVISAFILKKAPMSQVGHWMMSGQVFGPQEFLGTLIHQVVAASTDSMAIALERAASPILSSLLQAGPEAIRATKALLLEMNTQDWSLTKSQVCKAIADRRVSPEGQEGLTSFFEKRKAHWVQTLPESF